MVPTITTCNLSPWGMLVFLDHSEDIGEENEGNIKKVNEGFISMKGNLSI